MKALKHLLVAVAAVLSSLTLFAGYSETLEFGPEGGTKSSQTFTAVGGGWQTDSSFGEARPAWVSAQTQFKMNNGQSSVTFTITVQPNTTNQERIYTFGGLLANSKAVNVTVRQAAAGGQAASAKPDLAPLLVILVADPEDEDQPEKLTTADDLYVRIVAGNMGKGDAGPFAVKAILDGKVLFTATPEYLKANEYIAPLGVHAGKLSAGKHVVTLSVDTENAVDEEDETNNVDDWEFEIVGEKVPDPVSFGVGKVSAFDVGAREKAVVVGLSGLTFDHFTGKDYFGAKCFVNDGVVDVEMSAKPGDDNYWCGPFADMDMLYLTGWAGLTSYATVDDMADYFRKNPKLLRTKTASGIVEGTYGYDGMLDWFKDTTGRDLARYSARGTVDETFSLTLQSLLKDGKGAVRISVLFENPKYNPLWKGIPVSHAVTCCGYVLDSTKPASDPEALTGLFIIDNDNDQFVNNGGRTAPNSIVYCPVTWGRGGSHAYTIDGIWGESSQILEYLALANVEDEPAKFADLAIKDFFLSTSPTNPAPAKTMEAGVGMYLFFSLYNLGDADAVPFVSDLYLDDVFLGRITSDLGHVAGGVETVSGHELGRAEPGKHVLKAIVDVENSVEESDESNNVATFAFMVNEKAVDPDPCAGGGCQEDPEPEDPEPVKMVLMVGRLCDLDPYEICDELELEYDDIAECKFKGLPSGLKFDAREGTLMGVPTKAGTFAVTVTAGGVSGTVEMEVLPLPDWAVGNFNGYVRFCGKDGRDRYTTAKLTVGKGGKVSGSFVFGGKKWTLSADGYEPDEDYGKIDEVRLEIAATAKSGKETLDVTILVSGAADDDVFPATAVCEGLASGEFEGSFTLWRDIWKDKGAASLAKGMAGVYTVRLNPEEAECGYGYLSMTVSAKGTVKATGKLPDGVKVSGSLPLMYEAGDFKVLLSMTPSDYNGGSVFSELAIEGEGEGSEIVGEVEWTSLNPKSTGLASGNGFSRVLGATGGWYNKLADLNDYYASLTLSVSSPALSAKVKYVSADETVIVNEKIDSAFEVSGVTFAPDEKGAKFVLPKTTKPYLEDGEWMYEGENDAALSFSLAKATGIFKGSFTCWYDYHSTVDEESGMGGVGKPSHVSKKYAFEGIATHNDAAMKGFFTTDETATQDVIDKHGNKKTTTYTYTVSHAIEF